MTSGPSSIAPTDARPLRFSSANAARARSTAPPTAMTHARRGRTNSAPLALGSLGASSSTPPGRSRTWAQSGFPFVSSTLEASTSAGTPRSPITASRASRSYAPRTTSSVRSRAASAVRPTASPTATRVDASSLARRMSGPYSGSRMILRRPDHDEERGVAVERVLEMGRAVERLDMRASRRSCGARSGRPADKKEDNNEQGRPRNAAHHMRWRTWQTIASTVSSMVRPDELTSTAPSACLSGATARPMSCASRRRTSSSVLSNVIPSASLPPLATNSSKRRLARILGASGQKELHLGFREDDRADVAPLEHDPPLRTGLTLEIKEGGADLGVGGHRARPHPDRRGANGIRDVLAAELHANAAGRVSFERERRLVDQGGRESP